MSKIKHGIKKALILGSGGLRIGQAGEFDYSGSQAIKALKEEGIYTILINPNIATVQTDNDMADKVYFQPLQPEVVTKIIEQERPDAVLLSFGGQTALSLGLELYDQGVFEKFNVRVLGSHVDVIKTTEDRDLFKKALAQIDVKTAKSMAATNVEAACKAAKKIGYPIMMRSGFSLGGLGSGRVDNEKELREKASEVFNAVPQILIEEYLAGWKEIEYEIVRDSSGNTIAVCNMENFDPMGIHTGESIVVAPSQTLTNNEYQMLREVALKTIDHLGIIGECNIQYALNPKTGDYRVIEVNARLSRSSALASKATGYPLAFVAAKLMLGYKLYEIKNSVTKNTSAFFEPALDYIALKVPRWDLAKLKSSDHNIGSEMKSVGEVMALGRSFPEVLQKAIRMLNIGAEGLTSHPYDFDDPISEIKVATDRRIFAIYEAMNSGRSVEQVHNDSKIDKWFLHHLKDIVDLNKRLKDINPEKLLEAKRLGFSDKIIAERSKKSEKSVRKLRQDNKIIPAIKLIDTLAGEFDATTNYLYLTYHGTTNDVTPLGKKSSMVLGSGPYCIGSSVEFDWCAVNTAKTLRKNKIKTIIVNSNPETVSTDFDRSDRLYFDELTHERISDILDFENSGYVIVSVGGQIANNLSTKLANSGYKILGTSAKNIDRAEDRQKFSSMLGKLNVDQPKWIHASSLSVVKKFAKETGYPLLIRPSYVLSGGAMNVVNNDREMTEYIAQATKLSPDHPVVVSEFILGAKELEIDGVAKDGKLVIYAISEHIENAGVHSGDATIMYPAQRIYLETVREAKSITKKIIKNLDITGPFNIQFIAKNNEIKVIECNVRASRSFPFVSKTSGYNFIQIATEAMIGKLKKQEYKTLELDHVGIKSPQFSYNRLKGADPVAGVEMASTGEVACFGKDLNEAFYRSWLATDQKVQGKKIFLSIPDQDKFKFIDVSEKLVNNGWEIYSTKGTYDFLKANGIKAKLLYRIQENKEPNIKTFTDKGEISLVVSVPSPNDVSTPHAYRIRRLAIDNHVPILTNAQSGRILLDCLAENGSMAKEVHDSSYYLK
ncbi:MAG: carbamoyl-phosphate synthase (glutamine-hydrolyzing) large subunit [Patescibacteria group bacterium]